MILSVGSLMILIVLIANCVSCCKDPEIDFKVSTDGRNFKSHPLICLSIEWLYIMIPGEQGWQFVFFFLKGPDSNY